MSRPVRYTRGAVITTPVIPLDYNREPFNVGIGISLSAGASLTYTVEYTYDDIQSPTFSPATATWFSVTNLSAKTTSADGSILAPCTGLRLNIGVYASGSATITAIQAGMAGVN